MAQVKRKSKSEQGSVKSSGRDLGSHWPMTRAVVHSRNAVAAMA